MRVVGEKVAVAVGRECALAWSTYPVLRCLGEANVKATFETSESPHHILDLDTTPPTQ